MTRSRRFPGLFHESSNFLQNNVAELFADLHVHAHDTVGTNSTSANLKIDVAIERSGVVGWSARGFEHPEERVREWGSGRFEIESATHGDADELEIALEAPERATVAIHATISSFDGRTSARIDWQVSYQDLLQAGALRRDVERRSARPLRPPCVAARALSVIEGTEIR